MNYEVIIRPIPSGMAEYRCLPIVGEGFADFTEFLSESNDGRSGDIYELGVDVLPRHVKDIRGFIQDEPPKIIAIDTGISTHYFGIMEAFRPLDVPVAGDTPEA